MPVADTKSLTSLESEFGGWVWAASVGRGATIGRGFIAVGEVELEGKPEQPPACFGHMALVCFRQNLVAA